MDEEQTDTLGVVAIVIGVLTWLTCFGSCIPYLNIIFIFPSMILSLIGTIIGAIGTRTAQTNQASPGLSITGLVLNAVPLFIWLIYWVVTLLSLFGLLAMVFGLIAYDAVS